MQYIMAMNIKGYNMGILNKIWYGFFEKSSEELIKEYDYSLTDLEKRAKAQEIYTKVKRDREGTKIKGVVNSPPTTPRPEFAPPPQNPTRDFKREADEHFRQQQLRRESDDNFLTGAMVGYVIAESLNDNTSHINVEEPKSSSYESSYTPNSSSSYDSGSYSSSSDSGSSSCSCGSGC